MKYLQFFVCAFILVFALSSCKVYPPVYKRVENFNFQKINSQDGFKVSGELVFYNPNKLKVKLDNILMNVELNGKHIATAGQMTPVPINSNQEFAVPLNLSIKPDMSIIEGLQNIISIIQKKEVTLTLQGEVTIKALGIKIPIPIKETEKIDITKLR